MSNFKKVLIMILFVAIFSVSFGDPIVLENSSDVKGGFTFGGWDYFPNTGYRYAELWLATQRYTRSLYHPTHLNIVHSYSQLSGSADVKVYIATTMMSNINRQTDPHNHCSWWNANSANLGYYVGQFTTIYSAQLTSFNVEDWITSHPDSFYFVLFDQQDNFADVGIQLVWLGPPGRIGAFLKELPPIGTEKVANAIRPNPFSNTTNLSFSVSFPGQTTVKIYNANGKLIRTLLNEFKEAGSYTIIWDGKSDRGVRVPSGIYLYEISSPNSKTSGKIVVK